MEVVSTWAVAFMAVADAGEPGILRNGDLQHGEQDHAHYKPKNRDSSSKAN
jgi:hypothetical protein